MADKRTQEKAWVINQTEMIPGIMDLLIKAPKTAASAAPGQFISVYCADKSRLLPRPISICDADKYTGALRLVYRVGGAGTEEFSKLGPGETIRIQGPLGNGFPLDADIQSVLIVGGGIGIPPLLYLAKNLNMKKTLVMGYPSITYLDEELAQYGDLYIATEDGSRGTKGNVINAMEENGLPADAIMACGPLPMLKALKQYGEAHSMSVIISMEERMACGIGACLACVCKSTEKDPYLNISKKRVCLEGPVFDAREVEL